MKTSAWFPLTKKNHRPNIANLRIYALLFQRFATDLVENLAPLIGVEFLVEPGQGGTDHVAISRAYA